MKVGKTNIVKSKNEYHETATHQGNFDDMIAFRKKALPKLTAEVEEILEDYEGQTIAIVMSDVDAKGKSVGIKSVMVGCDNPHDTLKVVYGLRKSADILERNARESIDKIEDDTPIEDMIADLIKRMK